MPATPSTLEDYAGRNLGNGIDLPQCSGKRTVTVLVFVWYWYEGRREAANLGFRMFASGFPEQSCGKAEWAVCVRRFCEFCRAETMGFLAAVLNGFSFKELRFAYI